MNKFAVITPGRVILKGSPGDKIQKTVTITPAGKYDFSIIGKPVFNGKYIRIDLKQPDAAKKIWKLTIINKRKTPGRYFDIISLKTDNKINHELAIRVFGDLVAKTNLNKVSP